MGLPEQSLLQECKTITIDNDVILWKVYFLALPMQCQTLWKYYAQQSYRLSGYETTMHHKS